MLFQKRRRPFSDPATKNNVPTIGAVRIRKGFWGLFYYTYNNEPLKLVLVMIEAT